jgi:hypothetical protein
MDFLDFIPVNYMIIEDMSFVRLPGSHCSSC